VAKAKFIDDDAFEMMLSRAMERSSEVAEAVLKAGASVIADEMKRNLTGVLSKGAASELVGAFGITPPKRDRQQNWNVHLGFDGYQTPGQKGFPQGVPFQLLARTFESGAVMGGRYTGKVTRGKRETTKKKYGPEDYWRVPTPFAKPAVQATKQQAMDAMERAAEKEFEKLIERG
jgi:hypothetical protein